MAKKSILFKNKRTLVPLNENEEKIFHYLMSKTKTNSITASAISKGVNIPLSTVRRKLNTFIGQEYEYGLYYYKVEYVDNGFRLARELKNSPPTQKQYLIAEKEEHRKDLREANVQELANSRVAEHTSAIVLTQSVVLYQTTTRARTRVINILKNLYSDADIHDIVPCKKGIYIILKETTNLNTLRENLCKFYTDIVNSAKKDATPPQIPVNRKSSKEEGS